MISVTVGVCVCMFDIPCAVCHVWLAEQLCAYTSPALGQSKDVSKNGRNFGYFPSWRMGFGNNWVTSHSQNAGFFLSKSIFAALLGFSSAKNPNLYMFTVCTSNTRSLCSFLHGKGTQRLLKQGDPQVSSFLLRFSGLLASCLLEASIGRVIKRAKETGMES